MAKATIVITYTSTGSGYHLDIKCENAYLIGSGKSELIAQRMRKEIHKQRYHRPINPEPIEEDAGTSRRTATK